MTQGTKILQIKVAGRSISAALDLKGGGIKIEVANSFGKMRAKNYLDREAVWRTILSHG